MLIAAKRLKKVARNAYRARKTNNNLKEISDYSRGILPIYETFEFWGSPTYKVVTGSNLTSHNGLITRWRNFVSDGMLSEAIEESLEILTILEQEKEIHNLDNFRNIIIVIASEIKSLKKSEQKGDKTFNTLSSGENSLAVRFLEVLSTIKKENTELYRELEE